MRWYLYEDKIYGFNSLSSVCIILETSGKGFLREVIQGDSEITQFGGTCKEINSLEKELIETGGEPWTQEQIQKRLRKSCSKGGTLFETFLKPAKETIISTSDSFSDVVADALEEIRRRMNLK